MSELRTITVPKGPGGYGGLLIITPDEERSKVIYIVSGGQKPEVVDRIAELIGTETVNGFSARIFDDEHFCVVIGYERSLRCGLYPKKDTPIISVVPTGETGPLAQHIHEDIHVSTVGMNQVRPADADEAAEAQVATAAESVQKSVLTREDGHPMKLTEQMVVEQKKSLLERTGLGAGRIVAMLYQAGRNAIQVMINTILSFMGFVVMLIGITRASDLGDQLSHLLIPLAGSSWGLMALGLVCSLLFPSPLLGPGAVITQIVGALIGVKTGGGNIPSQLSLPALLAINTQNAYGLVPVGMGLKEAGPETIKVSVSMMLYSRFLNGAPRIVTARLASIDLYPQS